MRPLHRLFPPAFCGLLSLAFAACESTDAPGESSGAPGASTGASTAPDATSSTGGSNTDSSTDDPGTSTGGADPSLPGLEEKKSAAARATPELTRPEKTMMRDGNRDLSFELLRNSDKAAEQNVAVSAVSMRAAFGMVHAMAQGETQSEIATAMKLPGDPAKAQAGINDIDLTLMSRNLEKSELQEPVIMSTANRMFVKTGMTPDAAFLDTLAQNYGAGIYETDFAGNSAGALEAINGWVAQKTFDKIPELLTADAINSNTIWVLTNAMYFRAPWSVVMQNAGEIEFTKADGTKVSAPSIHSNDIGSIYGTQPGFEWAMLPLRGGKLGAIVVLPEVGKFQEVEAKMAAPVIEKMIAERNTGEIEVSMPKFKIETESMNYTGYLAQKMPKAFGPEADFGGFSASNKPTPVTFVYHSVFLAADENGVEAAAASAVGSGESAPNPQFSLNVDRPFLFLVYDQPSGLILFAGRVMDPTA